MHKVLNPPVLESMQSLLKEDSKYFKEIYSLISLSHQYNFSSYEEAKTVFLCSEKSLEENKQSMIESLSSSLNKIDSEIKNLDGLNFARNE